MRPIDAETLLKETILNPLHPPYITKHDVESMPTIDLPVKHGRWKENKYGYITCSVCDGFPLEAMTGSLITMLYEPYESEYCPHCGAKMDLKEQKKSKTK